LIEKFTVSYVIRYLTICMICFSTARWPKK